MNADIFSLAGKNALVTGGSRGIGAACARLLSARGAAVAITYSQNRDRADALVQEIEEEGGTAYAVRVDAGSAEAVKVGVQAEIAALGGNLDVLVNNADRSEHLSRFRCSMYAIWRPTGRYVMGRMLFAASLLFVGVPAIAQDELRPVAPGAFVGRPYDGSGLPSEIVFVNVRRTPLRLEWIGFDGVARVYAMSPPGGEVLQPTFVGHRWLVTRAGGMAPVAAFISTRSDVPSDGQPQIAVIR